MKTEIDRDAIADELMNGCPDELFQDHQKIADAIRNGFSFDDICDSTNISDWSETYHWVKLNIEKLSS